MPPVKVNHIESAWPTIITREVKRVRKSKNGQNLGFTSSIYALKSIWSKGGAGHLATLKFMFNVGNTIHEQQR